MYEAGEWVTPISILGTTKINETDNALEAIMNTDANSIRNFINAEFVDIETFLSTLASADITYDNGTSGLTATNVQSAIDEVEARVDINDGKVTNYNQTGAEIKTAYEAEANAYTDTKNTKLAGIAENANDYDHPTGDGNKHVPANSTTNEGKVLTAGAVAGTYTWEDSVGGITEEAEAQTKIGDLTIGETISVASWSYSGTTITVHTSTIHNVIVGQYFSVSGLIADTNAPNGRWAVATVIDTDSITFTAVDTPTGTPTVSSAELSHGLLKANDALQIKDAVLAPTGTAPMYACRAWVNFNGTGTVAIRASGNISSLTDIGAGLYGVNLLVAMDDSNYSVIPSSGAFTTNPPSLNPNRFAKIGNLQTSSFTIGIMGTTGGSSDEDYVSAGIVD